MYCYQLGGSFFPSLASSVLKFSGLRRPFSLTLPLSGGAGTQLPARKAQFVEANQADLPCPVLPAKIILFSSGPNHRPISCRPGPHRGAYRDRHGRWAWDAVDAAASSREVDAGRTLVRECSTRAQDERRSCVRQSCVVLAPVAGVKSAEVQHTQPGVVAPLIRR